MEKAYKRRTAFLSESPMATSLWEEWSRPPREMGRRNNLRIRLTNVVSRMGIKTMETGTAMTERIWRKLPEEDGDGPPAIVMQAIIKPMKRLPASPMNIVAGLKL